MQININDNVIISKLALSADGFLDVFRDMFDDIGVIEYWVYTKSYMQDYLALWSLFLILT